MIRALRPYSKNSLGSHLSTVCTIVSYSCRPRNSASWSSKFRGASIVRKGQPGMHCSKACRDARSARTLNRTGHIPRLTFLLHGPFRAFHNRNNDSQAYYLLVSTCKEATFGKAGSWKSAKRSVRAAGKFAGPEGTKRMPTCAKAVIATDKTRMPASSSGCILIFFVIACLIQTSC